MGDPRLAEQAVDDGYPVVFVDCMVFKIRDGGSVQRRAWLSSVAIGMDGEREGLGMWFQANECAKFWMQVLTDLMQRRANGILITCVDGVKGGFCRSTIEAVFPATAVRVSML